MAASGLRARVRALEHRTGQGRGEIAVVMRYEDDDAAEWERWERDFDARGGEVLVVINLLVPRPPGKPRPWDTVP